MDKLLALAVLCRAYVPMAAYLINWPNSYNRTNVGDNIDTSSMALLKATYESAEDKNVACASLGVMVLPLQYNVGSGP